MLDLRPMRAKRSVNRFLIAGVAVAVVATALKMIGFQQLGTPLLIVGWVLLMRSGYWSGWLDGHKQATKEQETIDA